MAGGVMECFVHRDDEGWYAVSDWDGDPIVFRLPEGYDPRDDEAALVFSLLGELLSERYNAGGEET